MRFTVKITSSQNLQQCYFSTSNILSWLLLFYSQYIFYNFILCFCHFLNFLNLVFVLLLNIINQTFITDSRSRFKKDNRQHIQPIASITNIKSYKIQQYQCLRVVLTPIFDKPTIISFLEALSRQINLYIRFRNRALKVIFTCTMPSMAP